MIETILLLIVTGIPTLLALLAIDSIAGRDLARLPHHRHLAKSGVHGRQY